MAYKDNQPYIYLRSTRERIPCTQEEFENYYREINAFRKKQQRHKTCICSENNRLDCDMDCVTCPFRRGTTFISLNDLTEDENGHEIEMGDLIEDPTPRIDEAYAEMEELRELLHRVSELMPEALEIGSLRLQGMSDRQIESRLGVLRQTMEYRLKRLKRQMEKEFPEFFKNLS